MNRKSIRGMLALLAILAVPHAAWATNGMYLAGYGAEANGRGGANIAVADRALGLQSNPAGIAQLMGNHFSVDLQVLMPDLDYSDPYGNSIEGESAAFIMPSFSYVRGGRESSWTWGIAMISQGGMGAEFNGYSYPSPPFLPVNNDSTYSQVRFLTISPTVAYSITSDLSIGLTANLGYSDVEFNFWPETTAYFGDPQNPQPTDQAFFGARMSEPASTFNYSFRLGLMWRASSRWQFGAVYQTKTEGDYEGGTLDLNMNSIGAGTQSYDADVEGFTWPEQFGIGVQFRPAQKWMLAFDWKRFNWSDAMSQITVTGSNSNAPIPTVEMPFVFLWEDQDVYILGGEYRINDTYTVRAGYNHGASPVPDDTLNPLFPAIVEDHATVGLGYNWSNNTLNFAIERGFENVQTNNNTDPMVNPFGPGATVGHSQWTISVGYSKAFGR